MIYKSEYHLIRDGKTGEYHTKIEAKNSIEARDISIERAKTDGYIPIITGPNSYDMYFKSRSSSQIEYNIKVKLDIEKGR